MKCKLTRLGNLSNLRFLGKPLHHKYRKYQNVSLSCFCQQLSYIPEIFCKQRQWSFSANRTELLGSLTLASVGVQGRWRKLHVFKINLGRNAVPARKEVGWVTANAPPPMPPKTPFPSFFYMMLEPKPIFRRKEYILSSSLYYWKR